MKSPGGDRQGIGKCQLNGVWHVARARASGKPPTTGHPQIKTCSSERHQRRVARPALVAYRCHGLKAMRTAHIYIDNIQAF